MAFPDKCKSEHDNWVQSQDTVLRLKAVEDGALKALKDVGASDSSISTVKGVFDAEISLLQTGLDNAKQNLMNCWMRSLPAPK
jgi:hypothetical protein